MKYGAMRNKRTSCTAMLAAIAWGAGAANGQIFQPTIPDFEPAAVFDVGVLAPYGIASADFLRKPELNDPAMAGQDGYPEIAVAGAGVNLFFYCDDPTGQGHNIQILRNTRDWDPPTDGLVPHQTLLIPSGIRTTELAFADVTGENGPDLVLLGYNSDTDLGYLLVYKNHGDGQFDDGVVILPSVIQVSGLSLRGLIAEDIDLDGDIDIIAAASNCFGIDKMVVFENLFAQTQMFGFNTPVSHSLGISGGTAPGDIVAGDFFPFGPGQPLLDLVTPNTMSSSITKSANLGSLQFSSVNENQPGGCTSTWDFVTAASGLFGADALWDFAAVREEDLAVSVFKGISSGQFENNCNWDPGNGKVPYQLYQPDYEKLFAHGIATGRLNADAYPDLVVAIRNYDVDLLTTQWSGAVAVLLGLPDGSFKPFSPTQAYIFSTMDGYGDKQTAGSALVEIVDLNADGFDDIVVSNHESGIQHGAPDNISVLINKIFESVSP